MVKIVNGSIVNESDETFVNNNKITSLFQQKNEKVVVPIQASSWMERLVKTLELETGVFGIQLRLKYLLAFSISATMLFGSIGLLSLLLIIYLGTLFNTHLKDSNNNNNGYTESYSNNSNFNYDQFQQQLQTVKLQNQQQQMQQQQNKLNEEVTSTPFHVMHSPKNLRRSAPQISTFSPNTGRRLGTSLDNVSTTKQQ